MFGSSRRWLMERFLRQWGKNPLDEESAFDRSSRSGRMERIRIFHDVMEGQVSGRKESRRRGRQSAPARERTAEGIDGITWNDLEMDEVFRRINSTKSFIGEQVLYRRLHEVQGRRDWERYERQLAFLSEDEKRRVELELGLHAIGKSEDSYVLADFLVNTDLWRIRRGWVLRLMQVLLVLSAAAAVIWEHALCAAALTVVVLTNLMIYVCMKQRYEGYLGALGSLKQICEFVRRLSMDERLWELFGSEEAGGAIRALRGLSGRIAAWSQRKYAGMSGDIFGILCDYLWGVTLLDVAAFNHMMRVIGDRQEEALLIVRLAGEVDAAISVASFRAGAEKWCVPRPAEEPVHKTAGIVHPLLENAQANDFVLENRAIITGANASGKSTFMKAIAVNTVMAQTIHTCTADAFSAPLVQVMSCMSLRDDIRTGESYYYREAKYIRRMLDQMESGIMTLYVFDEILKGTNTRERLSASTAILEYMVSHEGFVLVSTHDMELAETDGYANYYFESSMDGTDVTFDYRIHEGIGGSSNAIALLEALRYPDAIIRKAKRKAGESA